MALYTTKSYKNIASEWEDIQRRELERQQREAEEQYARAQQQAAQAQQAKKPSGLEAVLANIGESIGNVGKSLVSIGGRGMASIGDLFSGQPGKNLKDFEQWEKKELWGNENMSDKDLYNKTGGMALDAAATVSDLIPVVGQMGKVATAGKAAGKATLADKAVKLAQAPIFNMAQGGASGYAQEFINNGENARLEDALKRAAVGTVASGTGTFVGNKLANRALTNPATSRLGKMLQSNVGRSAITGATAGAVGGGMASALEGGDIGQVLSSAAQGSYNGALGGATMGATMGMLGTAADKLRNRKTATIATPETTVAKQAIAEPEVVTPTKRGIAVTDYDAGEQKVNVKRPNAKPNEYSLGKNAGSTLDGILGPNNKRKLPNLDQPTSSQILKKASGGEYADIADYLKTMDVDTLPEALKELKNYASAEDYAALQKATQDMADLNLLPLDAVGVANKSSLPTLNRQQYYEDTIGKVGNRSALTGRKGASYADVPDYMNSHLRNDNLGEVNGVQRRNDEILRDLFNDQTSDISDLYKRYEDLAQADNANYVYTPENVEMALRADQDLNRRLTDSFVNDMGLRKNLAVGGNPSLRQNVDVDIMDAPSNETVYTKRTIAPKTPAQPEQNLPAVRGEMALAAQEDVPLIQKGTPEYEAIKQRDFIENRKRELNRNLSDGILSQYGTVRLSDSSEIGNIRGAALDMAKLGLTDRADIDGFVSRITGAEGEIPKVIRKSLNSAGKTQGKINMTMQEAYNLAGADQNAQKRAKSTFDSIGKKPKYAVDANGNMNRLEMYEFGKELEKQAYKDLAFFERNGTNETLRGAGETLRILSQAFIDKATDGVDIKSGINANKLKNVLPGNERWANKVDDFIKNAKTVQDARSFISSPTKMSLWANAESFNVGTYGQRTGDMASTVKGAIKGATSANPGAAAVQMAATAAVESKPAQQAMLKRNLKQLEKIEAGGNGRTGIKGKVGAIAGGIGKKMDNIGRTINNNTLQGDVLNGALGDLATRRIARGTAMSEASNIRANKDLAEAQNLANEAITNYQNANMAYQNAMAQPQAQSRGANQLQTLSDAMDRALAAGDITAYGQLADLYKQAYSIYGKDTAQTTKALSANQSKALTGLQQVDQLEQMRPDFGTALANSPLSFLVNMTGGNEYANQAQSLALTLGYLQSGANITPREAENIGKSYVPTAYDSEQVRQQKLARARQLLNNYLGDTSALEQV